MVSFPFLFRKTWLEKVQKMHFKVSGNGSVPVSFKRTPSDVDLCKSKWLLYLYPY